MSDTVDDINVNITTPLTTTTTTTTATDSVAIDDQKRPNRRKYRRLSDDEVVVNSGSSSDGRRRHHNLRNDRRLVINNDDDEPDGISGQQRHRRRRAISSIEIDYMSATCVTTDNIDNRQTKMRRQPSASGSSSSANSSRSGQKSPVRIAGDVHCVASPEAVGSLDLLSQKYESLDYDQIENMLYLEERKRVADSWLKRTEMVRWLVIFIIGLLTAVTACVIVVSVEGLSKYKYKLLQQFVDRCSRNQDINNSGGGNDSTITSGQYCIIIPYAMWLGLNAVPVLMGSALVTYLAPIAAGSGIPVIKCYLNGIKVPEVVRIKTYFAKLFGVIMVVVGGLACGKEGPMIHCGSVIAAGVSQGKSTTFNKDFRVMQEFREDREKRDFVSAGAAAGVAAAFGAPVGGVLFSLEEGASFWNQKLTWRIFFCSLVSTFTLNLILSTYHLHPGQLSYSGLLNFGQFAAADFNYNFAELPLYVLMGAFGGLAGALFNYMNYKLTVFRIRYISHPVLKVLEAVVVAMVTATIGFLMIVYIRDCHQTIKENYVEYPIKYNCHDGEYSVMGALWFNTPEASLRNLFHNVEGTWRPESLAIFVGVYYFLSCWTYGLSVSSGLFIPSLLVGAAWGRLAGIGMKSMFPTQDWICPGKFALIGAAANLGGIVRMTISLTVILIEATGNLTFGLPIMITLITAKWVGDLFNEGIYDIHIQLSSIPFLNWEPPVGASNIYASEVMSTPVTTLKTTEKSTPPTYQTIATTSVLLLH
ncbi:H(+)/Cl(-) exchange transporter 7-like isoform X2 [Oppia nitens]|uniref:H(+)/Cl(-) exchange transporter 7-like isoform X2 n=1 Tax=Oppia nitens TaxID=1686743 RepID=UPI0023DB3B5E|nr:H(+)/Cl(-) exchange transporter 7-like isoform X2 [Oppia nitens]